MADKERWELQLASAGHFPPPLLAAGDAHHLEVPAGSLLGITEHRYAVATHPLPERPTIVAFTDGLIERRDEPIDASRERLRALVSRMEMPVDELVADLVQESAPPQRENDIAMVGVQWLT